MTASEASRLILATGTTTTILATRYSVSNDHCREASLHGELRHVSSAGLNKPNPPFEPADDRRGGIYVIDRDGELLDFLPVPRDEVTNCAFGGDDLKTLYITAGGTLYSIRTTTAGQVAWPSGR